MRQLVCYIINKRPVYNVRVSETASACGQRSVGRDLIRKNDRKNSLKQTKQQTKLQFVYKQTDESRD